MESMYKNFEKSFKLKKIQFERKESFINEIIATSYYKLGDDTNAIYLFERSIDEFHLYREAYIDLALLY